jgi:hypothetical protein
MEDRLVMSDPVAQQQVVADRPCRALIERCVERKDRLVEARCRQEVLRTVKQAPSSAVIADLSADFWVSAIRLRSSRSLQIDHAAR